MRFWDASAVVPLLVSESTSEAVSREFERDPDIVAWWGTEVECVSALARLEREGMLDSAGLATALGLLATLGAAWDEVQPSAPVRQRAIRSLRIHDLRAPDALQLAAAIQASEDRPASLPFVTLDARLARAAEREGFQVIMPPSA